MTLIESEILEVMSTSNIASAMSKYLGVDLTREEVQMLIDNELDSNKNYIQLSGIGKQVISLSELYELTLLDEEEEECLQDLRLSYLKDDYIKTLSIFLRDKKHGNNLIQRNHKLDVLRRKLEKIYDNKYGRGSNPKGHRKLIIKASLVSLVVNQNLM